MYCLTKNLAAQLYNNHCAVLPLHFYRKRIAIPIVLYVKLYLKDFEAPVKCGAVFIFL